MVNVGDQLPDATVTGETGPVKLRDKLGAAGSGKTLVIYFYPKDETPICTKEACSFRDAYEDFTVAGAEVIGISRDDGASHSSFKQHHRLPFTLLSDAEGRAETAFGIKKTLGFLPGRVTFVFDKTGVCKSRFDSQLRVGKHVDDALALVKKLAA